MRRTPHHHGSYSKTRREKVEVFPPRTPRSLILSSMVLNPQVTLLIPLIVAVLHADLRASPCQKRTLVTLEREKASQRSRRGVRVNFIICLPPTNAHDQSRLQTARVLRPRMSSSPSTSQKNPQKDLVLLKTSWRPSPLLILIQKFAYDSLLNIPL